MIKAAEKVREYFGVAWRRGILFFAALLFLGTAVRVWAGQAAGGRILAQATTPTPADGYPALPTATLIPSPEAANTTASGYPAGQTEGGQTPESYPGAASPTAGAAVDGTPAVILRPTQPPVPIGGQSLSTPALVETGDLGTLGRSNTLLLWLGFVAALLIFAGGVFGSILLFTRPNSKRD